MVRQIVSGLVIMVAVTSSALGQELQGREGTRYTWSERIPAGQWLRVYGDNGRIQVSEASGDVAEVVAEKDLRRGRPEDIGYEVRRTRDGITICEMLDEGSRCEDEGLSHRGRNRESNGRRVHFTIRVPRGVHVAVGSGNGDVSVTGATADVRAASGNGRVRVSAGGAVNASSGNGEVRVERAGGPVRAHSGNGDVAVATSRGPVSASSGNGDVDITMETIADVPDDMEFSSGNGRVTVTVPEDFAGELDASTGSGRVYSDFPLTLRGRIDPRHVRATIGRGGRRLTMRSGNGHVELRKR